jgi:hypothetical protein
MATEDKLDLEELFGGPPPGSPMNEEQTNDLDTAVDDVYAQRDRGDRDPEQALRMEEMFGGPPPLSHKTKAYADVPNTPRATQANVDLFGGPPPQVMMPLSELASQADTQKEAVLRAQGRAPTGVFSGIIDIISRFQYAEAAAVDEIIESELGIEAVGNVITRSIREFVAPRDRLSFTDIIDKVAPDFAETNPIAALTIGVALDTALDPTTWLTLGVGGAGKAIKIATKTGEAMYLTQKGASKLTRLTKVSQRYIADDLLTDAARFDWAEERIVKMASMDPTLTFQKGFQAHLNVPFSQRPIVQLLSPKAAKDFADMTGLTAMRNAIGIYKNQNAFLQSIGGTFRQIKELPRDYLKVANIFMSQAEDAADTVIMATAKMAKGINKEGALKIGRAAHGISDELMKRGKEGEDLTKDLVTEVQKRWFAAEKLGEKEVNVYSEMRRGLAEMRQAEINIGLEIKEIAEYFPRYYDNIQKGADATGEFYKKKRFTSRLAAAKSRVFDNIKQAEAAGLNPEWNAIKSFQIRAQASRKAIAKKQFDDSVEKLLKEGDFDARTKALIKRDAREIGDSTHPDFDKAWMNAMVNASDMIVNSVFRPAATILKPGFATFQALSNTVQMMWAGGAKLGLRSSADVAKHVIDNVGHGFGGKYWESIRKTLWNVDPNAPRLDSSLILKYLHDPSKLKNSRITTDIGTSFAGDEIAMMVKEMRIAQGTSVLGVPGFRKTAMGEIRRQNAVAWVADKTGASEGFVDFASSAATYWNWPRMVEDMARTNFFMNAIRQGHSPEIARQLVNKGLYDYTGGLSKFENMWVKRIMPFYSFTRFTLPLAYDVAKTKPGRLLNTSRGLKSFFGVWNKIQGGEQLNETERHAIPGWILEQPSTFAKFGMDGRAHFNAFTNWTPLDAVNFLEPGDEKNSSIQRTVKKTVLSMLSPVIKLPLEHVMNQNFFTGRAIKDIYRTKDRLGQQGTLWRAAELFFTDRQKEAMGWEVAKDLRTDKTNVYINPYLTHYMTGIAPVLNTVIRAMDADLTVWEKAMWTIGNVSTYKIDMQQQFRRLNRGRKAALKEKRQQIRNLRRQGLDGSAEEYQFELQQLLADIKNDRQDENAKEVRGIRNPPGGAQ